MRILLMWGRLLHGDRALSSSSCASDRPATALSLGLRFKSLPPAPAPGALLPHMLDNADSATPSKPWKARLDEEQAALARRQAAFSRDRDMLTPAEEEEHEVAAQEAGFRINILQVAARWGLISLAVTDRRHCLPACAKSGCSCTCGRCSGPMDG
jgi:hypothetical protein